MRGPLSRIRTREGLFFLCELIVHTIDLMRSVGLQKLRNKWVSGWVHLGAIGCIGLILFNRAKQGKNMISGIRTSDCLLYIHTCYKGIGFIIIIMGFSLQ